MKLKPILNVHSALNINNGVMIYKMLIRSILTYASTIWANTNKSNHNKIQTVQNKTLRNILQAPRHTKNTLIHDVVSQEIWDSGADMVGINSL